MMAQREEEGGDREQRRLQVSASSSGQIAELEFAAAAGGDSGNLEDRLALLTAPPTEIPELELPELESTVDRDASIRLLVHYALSVSHRQYHEVEVITVRVAPPARG